jgi:malonate-semialdehyde dehydrogenase (acetylating)/methylmalonate-semialdehyde dehydrogenase
MALSVMITVGQSSDWVSELVERARQLKLGEGFQEQTEV